MFEVQNVRVCLMLKLYHIHFNNASRILLFNVKVLNSTGLWDWLLTAVLSICSIEFSQCVNFLLEYPSNGKGVSVRVLRTKILMSAPDYLSVLDARDLPGLLVTVFGRTPFTINSMSFVPSHLISLPTWLSRQTELALKWGAGNILVMENRCTNLWKELLSEDSYFVWKY